MSKVREALDLVVVRALAAQQAFAEWAPNIHGTCRPPEPDSEKVVDEILAAVAEAAARSAE